jgi:hypothetical protein
MPGKRPQMNFRLTDELLRLVDARRVELQKKEGFIPTRTDIFRFALEAYLKPNGRRSKPK